MKTEIKTIKYGFWEEFDSLLEEYPDSEWGFIENFRTHNRTPYTFLHGECDIFAQYLQDTYGYQITGFYENPNQLIHAYCTHKIDNKTYYIDVRGIIDDWDEFIKEFCEKDMKSDKHSHSYFLKNKAVNYEKDLEKIRNSESYKASIVIDDEYGYYDMTRIRQITI